MTQETGKRQSSACACHSGHQDDELWVRLYCSNDFWVVWMSTCRHLAALVCFVSISMFTANLLIRSGLSFKTHLFNTSLFCHQQKRRYFHFRGSLLEHQSCLFLSSHHCCCGSLVCAQGLTGYNCIHCVLCCEIQSLCLANHVRHLNHRGPGFPRANPACHRECKDRLYLLRLKYDYE